MLVFFLIYCSLFQICFTLVSASEECLETIEVSLGYLQPDYGVSYYHIMRNDSRVLKNSSLTSSELPTNFTHCVDSSLCNYFLLEGWASFEVSIKNKSGSEVEYRQGKTQGEKYNFLLEYGNCQSVCEKDTQEEFTILTKKEYSVTRDNVTYNHEMKKPGIQVDPLCISPETECMKLHGTFTISSKTSNVTHTIIEDDYRLGSYVTISYDDNNPVMNSNNLLYYLRDTDNSIISSKNFSTFSVSDSFDICFDSTKCNFLFLEGYSNVTATFSDNTTIKNIEVNDELNENYNVQLGSCKCAESHLSLLNVVFDDIDLDFGVETRLFRALNTEDSEVVFVKSITNETHGSATSCIDERQCYFLFVEGSANFTIYLSDEQLFTKQVSFQQLNHFQSFGSCPNLCLDSDQVSFITKTDYSYHERSNSTQEDVILNDYHVKTICFAESNDLEITGSYNYIIQRHKSGLETSGQVYDETFAFGSRILITLEAINQISGVEIFLLNDINEILYQNITYEPIPYLNIPTFEYIDDNCKYLLILGSGIVSVNVNETMIYKNFVLRRDRNIQFSLQIGDNCFSLCPGIEKHDLLTVLSTKDFSIFNASKEELISTSSKANVKNMCLKQSDCLAISGPSYYYFFYSSHNEALNSFGSNGYNHEAFGSGCNNICFDEKKPLLVSTKFGKDVLLTLSSVSGMKALTDFSSPQYMAACWIIYGNSNAIEDVTKLIQRYIISLLFYSLNGLEWFNKYYFTSPKNECSWNNGIEKGDGVFCNNAGQAIRVKLNRNKLEGEIPFEILHLKSLEYINLSFNRLRGTIPTLLDAFPNLKELVLFRNRLTGTIPSLIFNLEKLETLDLENCDFTGTLPSISTDNGRTLNHLQSVLLSRNRLSGSIPQDFYSNSSRYSLRKIRLDYNKLTGSLPRSVGNLTNLEELSLNNNSLSSSLPKSIFKLKKLRILDLDNNKLTGYIPQVSIRAKANLLEELYLGNNLLTGSIPIELSSLTKLKHLKLSGNRLTGAFPFVTFKGLQSLQIHNNFITGTVNTKITRYTSVSADCDPSRKILCENCACYGSYTSPNNFETCSRTLTINFGNVKHLQTMKAVLKNEEGETVYKSEETLMFEQEEDSFSHSKVLPMCISFSSCYDLYVESDFEASINASVLENLVLRNRQLEHHDGIYSIEVSFGYSNDTNLFSENKCDSIKIDAITVDPMSDTRYLLNQLTQISEIGIIQNTSKYFPFVKWSLNDLLRRDGIEVNSASLQRYLLKILYYHTGGDDWKKSTNWFTQSSECIWYGIICDFATGTVITTIDLRGNNLVGVIPTEIGAFRGLEYLWLSENHLTGSIPSEIANLLDIQELVLSNNELSTLPSEIGLLTKLKVVDISSNNLYGTLTPELGNVKSLQKIDLSDNNLVSRVPDKIGSLTYLNHLNLRKNSLSGNLTEIQNLYNLETLDLGQNFFSGSLPLARQTKLRKVYLERNDFSGSVPPIIGTFQDLTSLILYNNRLTSTIPSELHMLNNLTSLSLSFNLLKGTIPKALQSLTNLELFHIHHNLISGDGDIFESIDSYIADCGKDSLELECTSCTYCCNDQNECIDQSTTWPQKGTNATSKFMTFFCFSYFIFFCVCLIIRSTVKLPPLWFVVRNSFQEGSVYRFFLTQSKMAWVLASLCVFMQISIFLVFVQASDYTLGNSDWTFTSVCPSTSMECHSESTTSWYGWTLFSTILTFFLVGSFVDSVLIIYESMSISDVKSLFSGTVVNFVTVISLVISYIYNMSTGVTNTDILKDVVLLLFLNDMDEQMYAMLNKINPHWIEKLEMSILYHTNELERKKDKGTKEIDEFVVHDPIDSRFSSNDDRTKFEEFFDDQGSKTAIVEKAECIKKIPPTKLENEVHPIVSLKNIPSNEKDDFLLALLENMSYLHDKLEQVTAEQSIQSQDEKEDLTSSSSSPGKDISCSDKDEKGSEKKCENKKWIDLNDMLQKMSQSPHKVN